MSTNARDTRPAATRGAIKVFEAEKDRDKTSSGGSGAMFSRCCKERVCIYSKRYNVEQRNGMRLHVVL